MTGRGGLTCLGMMAGSLFACLAPYEYVADGEGEAATTGSAGGAAGTATTTTTSSSGGSPSTGTGSSTGDGGGGATSASGGGGGAGGRPDCPVRATDGPYGTAELYFGEPALDPIPPSPEEFAELHGMVSPDGTRFTRRWTGMSLVENVRDDPFGAWGPTSAPSPLFYELFGHLTADNRRIFSCHGGAGKCTLHVRDAVASPFTIEHYFQEHPPFDGAARDLCFVPTPDGRHLAFCSNRASAELDEPGAPLTDLWMAMANDPGDPTAGYGALVHLATPSDPTENDEPTWLDDDAETLVFHSTRAADRDLWITSRATGEEAFGQAVKIAALSRDGSDEAFFTLPSLATLREAPCAAGHAFFQRDRDILRVPVCVGAPCE